MDYGHNHHHCLTIDSSFDKPANVVFSKDNRRGERSFLRVLYWPKAANERSSKLEFDRRYCSTLTLPRSATQAEDEAARARGSVIEKNWTRVHEIHPIEPC